MLYLLIFLSLQFFKKIWLMMALKARSNGGFMAVGHKVVSKPSFWFMLPVLSTVDFLLDFYIFCLFCVPVLFFTRERGRPCLCWWRGAPVPHQQLEANKGQHYQRCRVRLWHDLDTFWFPCGLLLTRAPFLCQRLPHSLLISRLFRLYICCSRNRTRKDSWLFEPILMNLCIFLHSKCFLSTLLCTQ